MFLTRPTLTHLLASLEELQGRVDGTYTLSDAARAYEELEGRRTTGKLLFAVRP